MERNPTETAIRQLIEEFSRKPVDDADGATDLIEHLDLDSLSALRLLALIEKRMNVIFPNEELAKLRTLSKLVDAIERARKGNQ